MSARISGGFNQLAASLFKPSAATNIPNRVTIRVAPDDTARDLVRKVVTELKLPEGSKILSPDGTTSYEDYATAIFERDNLKALARNGQLTLDATDFKKSFQAAMQAANQPSAANSQEAVNAREGYNRADQMRAALNAKFDQQQQAASAPPPPPAPSKYEQSGKAEADRMMADPVKILYNAAVNIVESLPNALPDLYNATKDGQIVGYAAAKAGDELAATPQALQQTSQPPRATSPEMPRVNLSSIKGEYRSEMMQRDDAGKKIEGDVTLAAPLVVGMAMKPSAPLQELNLPRATAATEATAATTTTTANVARQGKIIETQGTFSERERPLAEFLKNEGKTVEKLAENHALPGRKADSLVDGIKTEFKKLDPGASNSTVKDAINNSIRKEGQSRNIAIDARGTGLTEDEARHGLARAAGITRGKVDSVRIVGDGFDITATKFK